MPRSLDNTTITFSLASDAGKPDDTRPAFLCRFMSWNQHEQHTALMQQAKEEKDDAAAYELVLTAIRIGVVGWRNFDREFSHDALRDVLTQREIWELAWNYPIALTLAERQAATPPTPASV